MVNNLVSFADAGAGEKQLANITEVMDHSVELAADVLSVTKGLRFKDVVINHNYADDLPQLRCHVPELQQVFLSLFRYSCYALGKIEDPEHTPSINIEISEFYDAVWVRIQHNGLGMTTAEQQLLFEPFFASSHATAASEGQNGTSEEKHSAGERLSFAQFIIAEQHQGKIAVTSDINIGTTFHIQLPYPTAADPEAESEISQ